jgi:hypothetical protein
MTKREWQIEMANLFAKNMNKKIFDEQQWVDLTDEELLNAYGWRGVAFDFLGEESSLQVLESLRKVEAKIKEKNCE